LNDSGFAWNDGRLRHADAYRKPGLLKDSSKK
jgi:hypothetical protein